MIELTIHQYQDANRKTITELSGAELSPEIFGMLLVDALRHMAKAMDVPEERIWAMVDAEREHPTTDITTVVPN